MQRNENGCKPTQLETIKVIHIFRTGITCFDRSDSGAFFARNYVAFYQNFECP